MYNIKLENKVNKVFKDFKEFNEQELISKIKEQQNYVFCFVGAGILNEYLLELERKDFFVA